MCLLYGGKNQPLLVAGSFVPLKDCSAQGRHVQLEGIQVDFELVAIARRLLGVVDLGFEQFEDGLDGVLVVAEVEAGFRAGEGLLGGGHGSVVGRALAVQRFLGGGVGEGQLVVLFASGSGVELLDEAAVGEGLLVQVGLGDVHLHHDLASVEELEADAVVVFVDLLEAASGVVRDFLQRLDRGHGAAELREHGAGRLVALDALLGESELEVAQADGLGRSGPGGDASADIVAGGAHDLHLDGGLDRLGLRRNHGFLLRLNDRLGGADELEALDEVHGALRVLAGDFDHPGLAELGLLAVAAGEGAAAVDTLLGLQAVGGGDEGGLESRGLGVGLVGLVGLVRHGALLHDGVIDGNDGIVGGTRSVLLDALLDAQFDAEPVAHLRGRGQDGFERFDPELPTGGADPLALVEDAAADAGFLDFVPGVADGAVGIPAFRVGQLRKAGAVGHVLVVALELVDVEDVTLAWGLGENQFHSFLLL